MGIVRDLYYARKMSAGLKLPAPTVALLIKRLRLAAAMGGDITKTVIGTMVHITDALAKEALSVLVNITPIQPGSGDPSPSNVRPISGLTGLSVYRRGKNLLNAETNIKGKGTAANGDFRVRNYEQCTDLIPVKEGETYVWSNVSGRNTGDNRWHGYDANGDWVKQIKLVSSNGMQGLKLTTTATMDSGISYVRLSYGIDDTEAMIEKGSTATAYQPYGYDEYSVDWSTQAGTVYGGSLDVVTGELTVDWAMVDMGTLTWTYRGNGVFTSVGVAGYSKPNSDICYCSAYKGVSAGAYSNLVDKSVQCGNFYYANKAINVKDTAYSDAATFKTAMSGVQLCYELATPITYQLTPQEVQMLLGENYVWSSSGDTVSVTYYAEGNANTLQSLNILLGGNYSNPKTADDVSDKEALEIILGGNK